MDELARYNKERWEDLAAANISFSRPLLDMDAQSARNLVDPMGVMGDVEGKEVLCLASGGGQQSVAFAILGASVTVLDLSETMLARDAEAATHYNLPVTILWGDMRDLSRFGEASFDLVWHAYSINFVSDPHPVFREITRVLRPGGLYRMECANPFLMGTDEGSWSGQGYLLSHPYGDTEVIFADPHWNVEGSDGITRRVRGPREFRHTLSTIVNGLAAQGVVLRGVWEEPRGDLQAAPGTWEHFKAIAPPWLTFWATYRPDILHG